MKKIKKAFPSVYKAMVSNYLKYRMAFSGVEYIANAKDLIAKDYSKPNVTFIQLGSNDGKSNDPLYNLIDTFDWAGVCIEPLLSNFKKLSSNHSNHKNVICINGLIDVKEGERTFYYFSIDTLEGRDISQVGSLLESHLSKFNSISPDIKKYITSSVFKCYTLNNLASKLSGANVDILHSDLEGYDFQILSKMDFNVIKPATILFEHRHMTRKNYLQLVSILKKQKYTLKRDTWDTIAHLKHVTSA